MICKVSVSKCKRWVETRVCCCITKDIAIEFMTEAAQVANDQGVKNFLFDVRGSSNTMTPIHNYSIVHYHLEGLGLSRTTRSALLVSQGDRTHDFFELTATNIGHHWRVFDDEHAAMEWLAANAAQPDMASPSESVTPRS